MTSSSLSTNDNKENGDKRRNSIEIDGHFHAGMMVVNVTKWEKVAAMPNSLFLYHLIQLESSLL